MYTYMHPSFGVPSINHDVDRRLQVGFAANGKGIRDVVHNWVGSFFSIATLFKRLDNEGTYIREMQVSGTPLLTRNLFAVIPYLLSNAQP